MIFAMVSTKGSLFYTYKAVESFLRNTEIRAQDRILLIDNDNQMQHVSGVELIRNEFPKTFSANVNFAISIAAERGEDLIFLNNDIIFTEQWLEPLIEISNAITIPFSNQQAQYQTEELTLTFGMDWEQFDGKYQQLDSIVKLNRAKFHGSPQTTGLLMGFYCFRLPYNIFSEVGKFDESFGNAGGEDVDYRIRTILAGFEVVFATTSYLLHFGGKSTWRGGESGEATRARDAMYRQRFVEKWGEEMANIFLVGGDLRKASSKLQVGEMLMRRDYVGVVRKCLARTT